MKSDSRIMAFAATINPAAAKKFYEESLGLKLISDDMFALVFDSNGTMLRIQKLKEHTPVKFTVLGWEVTDINSEIDTLTKSGVVFNRYEGLPQDERNIWTTQDGTKVAWFNDPDGNILSLTRFIQ